MHARNMCSCDREKKEKSPDLETQWVIVRVVQSMLRYAARLWILLSVQPKLLVNTACNEQSAE